MSLLKLSQPRVGVSDGAAWRRAGLLYRKSIPLASVERIVALKRDRVTSEEIFLAYFVGSKVKFWVSEFDQGYEAFLQMLPGLFPGIRNIKELGHGKVFESVDYELWQAAPQAGAASGT